MKRVWLIAASIWLVSTSLSGFASDQRRENDYAAALQQQPGLQTLSLSANNHQFVAVFQAAERSPQPQAVILVHDLGGHPDQQPVISSLRQQLPQHQWSSLSIQMPLRESGASEADYYSLFDEAKARVEAALTYLHEQKIQRVAIVGYGLGASMALYAVQSKPTEFSALVAISLPVADTSLPQLQAASFLKALSLPLLDVYAEHDLPSVVITAKQRRISGAENPVYRQIKMDGLDHLYLANPDLLIKRVYSWLNSVDQ